MKIGHRCYESTVSRVVATACQVASRYCATTAATCGYLSSLAETFDVCGAGVERRALVACPPSCDDCLGRGVLVAAGQYCRGACGGMERLEMVSASAHLADKSGGSSEGRQHKSLSCLLAMLDDLTERSGVAR